MACKYYNRATKRNTVFRADQRLHHAESLFQTKKYKKAAKMCNKALQYPKMLGWTKVKFEKLLADITALKPSARTQMRM